MEQTYFILPEFNQDTPLNLHWVWKYLDEKYKFKHELSKSNKDDIQIAIDALESIGFRVGENTLEDGQFKYLMDVIRYWQYSSVWFPPHTINELFVQDISNNARIINCEIASDLLKQLTKESGFVYEVISENCYYEIINNTIYAKYSKIIGSRRICKIKE